MRNNLISTRKNNQFTQEKLANILGITTRHYQLLEAGTSEGSVKIWKQLAHKFNVTIDFLLEQEDTDKTSRPRQDG